MQFIYGERGRKSNIFKVPGEHPTHPGDRGKCAQKPQKIKYNLLGSLVQYSPCIFQIKTNLSDASTAWNAVNITKMWRDAVNEQAYSEQRMSR